MGYRPDPLLTALAHYRTGKTAKITHEEVGWMNGWPDPNKLRSYREFDLYWRGASEAAAKFGYHLEEYFCSNPAELERTQKALLTRGVRGLLIPPQQVVPEWNEFPWSYFTLVRLGRSTNTPRALVVTSDQVANTMIAAEKMRSLGYNRVGFVAVESLKRGMLFQAGYLRAQAEWPEESRLRPLCMENLPPEAWQTALSAWLKETRPDAILTDVSEMRAMLEKAGYRVPDDIGLAAESILDGNADAGIDQNPLEIGRVSFLLIMSQLNDHARGVPPIFRQILVEGMWVDGSTLPPRV